MAVHVKIDKETLIKHHFWILLGVSVLLVVIALIVLPTSVGSTVEDKEKEFASAKQSLQSVKDVKNKAWVEALETKNSHITKKKDSVWEAAWQTQKDLMTWPPSLQADFSKKYPYFGDPISLSDRTKFSPEYQTQIFDVVNIVQPINDRGQGVVQFKGGYDAVLALEQKLPEAPTSETIWLLQEDLWVKRELLRVIREANDSFARFQEVKPAAPAEPVAKASPAKEKPAEAADAAAGDSDKEEKKKEAPPPPTKPKAPPSDPNHKIFRNPDWELDLKLTSTIGQGGNRQYTIGGTIKNISNRKQALGIVFKVLLEDREDSTAFELLPVDRPALAAGESAPLKEVKVRQQVTVAGLFGVEQVLNWRTAPVKRIDQVVLDYPSSRTANKWRIDKKPRFMTPPPGSEAAEAAATPSSTAIPGGPMLGGKGMGAEPVTRGSSGTNSLAREDRYTDVNEQVRHMPVGMVVIVEEDRIPDFLAAFSNSRLKIQTLQVHWNHCRERIRPEVDEEDLNVSPSRGKTGEKIAPPVNRNFQLPAAPKGGMAPGAAMMGAMGMAGQAGGKGIGGKGAMEPGGGPPASALMMRPGMAQGGMLPGMGTASASHAASDDEEMKLVELAVYGLASLYERYPPKPPANPDGSNPGATVAK